VDYVFYLATSYSDTLSLYYPGPYLGCWTGGGFSSSLYRKSRLVAVCGGGGGPGLYYNTSGTPIYRKGGSGGGVNVSGQSGESAFLITAPGGTAPAPGTFLTGRADYPFGSSINSCSNGVRVINSTGVPACNDFPGLTQLIVVRSLEVGRPFSYNAPSTTSFIASNSASISRGHKLGFPWGYRFNGPDQEGTGGEFTALGAGAGANPGTSGGYFHSNGVPASGGGSGYHDGSISVVSTQLGGNSNPAGYIIIQAR
jgi:hypothetical protein